MEKTKRLRSTLAHYLPQEYTTQMRFTISSEQLKFFHTDGYLTLENLLTQEEASSLIKSIDAIRGQTPGYPAENLFRSTPLIATLAKKRDWGEIVYELIHKKPLSLAYDEVFDSVPVLKQPLDDSSCGLVINLNALDGFFFKEKLPPPQLYDSAIKCYFLLIFTANRLPEHINPIIMR